MRTTGRSDEEGNSWFEVKLREGMTQQDLASLAQVTRQTIIAIESGRYVPSLILAIRIARALGQTVEEVFELAE